MRVVAVGPGQTLEVREVDEPTPEEGGVVIDVAACGICGSDLHMLPSGVLPEGAVLGHELAGTVAAIGPGVEGWAEGDRVCVYPFAPVDRLDIPLAMSSGLGLGINDGGYAERIACDAAMLWRLPDRIELDHGALVEPLAVGLHAARLAGVEPGDRVFVAGAGTIGLVCLLAARRLGAEEVFVGELSPHRREVAARLGATVLDAGTGTVPEQVREATGGGVERAFDAVGLSPTLADALAATADCGTVVLVGMGRPRIELDLLSVVVNQRRIVGTFCYSERDFRDAAAWVASGTLELDLLIERRAGFDEIAIVFHRLALGEDDAVKALLVTA